MAVVSCQLGNLLRFRNTRYLLILLGGSIFLFGLYYLTGSQDQDIAINARILFNLLAPITVFFIFGALTLGLLDINIFGKENIQILSFVTAFSVFGIFFAITLNTRSFYLSISLFSLGLSPNQVVFVVIAILAPIIEEFAKIYPSFVICRQFTKRDQPVRLVNHPRYFLFFAFIGGGIFNMLETYFYSWQVGSLANISNPNDWDEIRFQLVLRAINPIHITAAMIVAVGIIRAQITSTEPVITGVKVLEIVPYYLGAVFLHGMWNGSDILFPNQSYLFGLPIINVFLIPVTIFIFLMILRQFRDTFVKCSTCLMYHDLNLPHDTIPDLVMSLPSKLTGSSEFRCKNCGQPKSGKDCPNCSSTSVFACSNCKYPIPIFAMQCWKCEKEVETVMDQLSQPQSKSTSKVLLGFFVFFTLTYIMQFFSIIFPVIRTVGTKEIPIFLILFFVISMALIWGLYYSLNYDLKNWGLCFARYTIAMILILITILLILISTILFTVGITISAFILLLFTIGYLYLAIRLLIPPILFVEVIE